MADKIHLRPLNMDDLSFLDQIENNPIYWSLSDTKESFSKDLLIDYIKASDLPISEVGQQRFVVARPDDSAVGFIDLFNFNYLHRRAGVGIIIEKEFRTKGYATQALELLCQYALKELKLYQLFANILEDNNESIAFFEQFGFEKTAVKRDWHYSNGLYKNEYVYQYLL